MKIKKRKFNPSLENIFSFLSRLKVNSIKFNRSFQIILITECFVPSSQNREIFFSAFQSHFHLSQVQKKTFHYDL